jgi:SAM-dependent methyltransferase
MEIFQWIQRELRPRACTSVEIFYDFMESQSFECLPVIYQPFDAGKRGHWCDRGAMLDFLLSTRGEGKRLLDFGPGDGWPSLIVAPHAARVVGVDGSPRRVEVCIKNAGRLGITNAEFHHVEPGRPLPFDDETFDGIMAASSVEQAPDPQAVLREFYRVLRPGGRLRMAYEDLDRYRDSSRYDTWVWPLDGGGARLVLYDRHIEEEYAVMYGITFSETAPGPGLPLDGSGVLPFDRLTVPLLACLKAFITDTVACRLSHPSGRTFFEWLNEIGFSEVIPSHSGTSFAGEVFERLGKNERPRDMDSIDAMLRPVVDVVVGMRAPLSSNPLITAVK